jgi:hypothetical protein
MAKRADHTRKTYDRIAVPALPALAALHNHVLEQSEKRSPKWRFRLGAELGLQLQVKPYKSRRYYFEGRALLQPDIGIQHFAPKAQPEITLLFALSGGEAEWQIEPSYIRWTEAAVARLPHEVLEANRYNTYRSDDIRELITPPLLAALPQLGDSFLPSLLFEPKCMNCGRTLTDPVSQARGIGPECFGSASEALPWLIEVAATAHPVVDNTTVDDMPSLPFDVPAAAGTAPAAAAPAQNGSDVENFDDPGPTDGHALPTAAPGAGALPDDVAAAVAAIRSREPLPVKGGTRLRPRAADEPVLVENDPGSLVRALLETF